MLALYERVCNPSVTDPKEGKWEVKINDPKIKVQVKNVSIAAIAIFIQKGTELSRDFPCIMTDMYFEAGPQFSMKGLIKAIHNPEEREKWDKDVEYSKILEIVCSGKTILFHQRMKSAISFINRRDFLEKKLKFKIPIASTDATKK